MKEKLIKLMQSVPANGRDACSTEELAEHLIQNGIVVLPCKVGDTVYIKGEPAAIDSIHIDKTITYRVRFLCYGRDCSTCPFYEKHDCKAPDKITTDDIGVTVFLSREEAEKKLKECEQ